MAKITSYKRNNLLTPLDYVLRFDNSIKCFNTLGEVENFIREHSKGEFFPPLYKVFGCYRDNTEVLLYEVEV